ncbi:MAG: GNAT family N-acetyltransferase [Pseudomonadota bacterium]
MILKSETVDHRGRMLTVALVDAPTEDVRRLMDGRQWGSPGGLLYRNKTTQWDRIDVPRIGTVHDADGRLLAAVVFSQLPWGTYLAAVTVLPEQTRQGLASLLVGRTADWIVELGGPDHPITGLVVGDNTAALEALFAGGVEIGAKVDALMYSRVRTRTSSDCRAMRPQDRDEVLTALTALNRGWQDADTTLMEDEYYICVEGGRIVAGMQAVTQRLAVEALGTPIDPFAMWALPKLLGVTAEDFRFLMMFHVFGSAPALDRLCSHVLSEQGLKLACLQLDREDPVRETFVTGVRPGLGARLTGVDKMLIFASGDIPRPMSVTPLMGTFS